VRTKRSEEGERKMSSTNLPTLGQHLDTLTEIFKNSNPSMVFSNPGFIDFFCANGRITNRVEEKSIDEEGAKGLVLFFLARAFFEPIFIVKDGTLSALRSRVRKGSLPGSTQLFPKYAWAGRKHFPKIIEDLYSREGQMKNALWHYDNEIAVLNDLLSQLREAEAILHLVEDEKEIVEEKKRSPCDTGITPWKVRVYFNR
jgi:hypothetical protein